MPELGCLDRRQAVSLLGLAPVRRHLLYTAATAAIGCEPSFKVCYERLTARGKSYKVALVTVMRKLVRLLENLLREDRMWQVSAPAPPLEAEACAH